MMELPNLVAFLAVAGVLVVTPGPDMALVTRNAVAEGRRAALLTAIGVELGLVV
jgi:threonine/homoserine/homoserine lactone efflux protein